MWNELCELEVTNRAWWAAEAHSCGRGFDMDGDRKGERRIEVLMA